MISISRALETAVKVHQAGDLRQAESLYRQILEEDPRQADALHLCGLIAHVRGQHAVAVELIGQALAAKPDFAEAHGNLGVVFKEQGRLDEAAACYRRALQVKPDLADAHNHLGVICMEQGRPDEAAAYYQEALRLNPSFAEAHNNLANVLRAQGKIDQAEAEYRRAVRHKADDPIAHNNLGVVLRKQARLDEAAAAFRMALRLRPKFAEAHDHLGAVLRDKGNLAEAVASFREAVRLEPNFAQAHNHLGSALREQGEWAEAEVCYAEALRLEPGAAEFHVHLGVALMEQGKLKEAEVSFREALRLKPDFAPAHMNLSIHRLLSGDVSWASFPFQDLPSKNLGSDCPWGGKQWDGSDLAGQTILLQAEQRLGDTLQLIRFAPMVKKRGGRVLLACHAAMVRLLASCAGVDQLICQGEPLPPFDVYASLRSLPNLLGATTPEDVPTDTPYLEPSPELIRHWRERLRLIPGLRVGIAWQGNPGHPGDRWRSVALARFAPLAGLEGVSLISLQKGFGSEQLAQIPGMAIDVGSECTDLADTAAVMRCLHLVVTIDSAVAHLAGALGVPAWVALPFSPDGRWLLGRDDSPWYPSLRLFRQARPKDWNVVFRRLTDALRDRASAASVAALGATAAEVGDMPRQAGHAATGAELAVVATAPLDRPDASPQAAEALMEDVTQRAATAGEPTNLLALARARHELGDWPEAERLYRQMVQLQPDAVEAHNGLGILLARQGRAGEAEACFRQVARLAPESAQARSNLGNVLRQQGRLAEAEASQRQALYLQADSALAHNNLGLVLAAQARHAEAEACYREALRLQPNFAAAHDNLGNTLRDLSRWAEAEASHHAALQLNPNSAHAHNHLGLTLAALGRLAEAEACYRQSIQLHGVYAEARLNLGHVLKDQGKLDEAIVCFRQALELNPHYAEAHYALGNALKDQRRYAEAEACYRQTLLLKPTQPEVHNNLGIVLMDLGRLEESAASYQQTLRLKPDFAATHNNLGIVLMRLERVDEAIAHLRQALRFQPDFVAAHNNLGVALQKQGKLDEAVDCFRQALHWSPDFVEAYNNLGNIHKDRGDKAQAEACFKETVRLKPDDADARNHLAIFLMDQGKMGEALAEFHEALRIRPDFPEGYNNLGLALQKHGKLDEAEASLRRAISLRPNFYEAINNLGNVVKEQGKLDEAIACYQKSVGLKPDFAGGHSNLGIMYFQEGQLPEAGACYEQALRIDPEYADARWNRSLLWLMGGDFARGWPEYEWRWQRPECPKRTFAMPTWRGDDLAGRTILLHAEQGLGDTLQFIRYAPMVKERGGTVLVECQPALVRLLERCRGIDVVLAQGDALPVHDVHAALLSLPHLLGTSSLERIPREVPYLHPDRALVEHWRARLASVPGLRVGITWQGNPSHRGDRWRSVPLALFAALAKIPGVSLVSLQKGVGSEQLEQMPGLALDLAAEFLDMADTAAALRSLDLVVTVDSAVAHLAGTLGVPVWVAMPFAPDWRWLLHRPDSPWYPTMRLFRQPGWKQWDAVFERIAAELTKQLSNASCPLPLASGRLSDDDQAESLPAADFAEAVRLHQAGNLEQAEPIYRRIVQDDPGHAQAWHFLGLIAHEGGRNEEALGCLNRAVVLAPERADSHNNLGLVLQQQGKLPEAEANLRRALSLQPDFAEAHNNLGGVLKDLGKPAEALAEYQQALRLAPDDADTHWNLALLYLLLGDFERGWAEFEWRRRREVRPAFLQFAQPAWTGDDLTGRTILLHAEHGLGNTMQFVRYAPLVQQRGGKVLLACHPPLKSLLGRCPGVDQVLAWDEPLPPFDVQAPLLSLPHLLGTTALERIPGNVPYLHADPERVEHWRVQLKACKGLRVGIGWQGNPQFIDDRWRSVPLTRFEAVARLPGVKVVSLQKGFGAEQWRDVAKRWAAVDLGAELDTVGAFLDTAAVMKNLDLVVTTDTSLAHLAGALGVPVWVALPFVPDWRWLLDRHDSPWYPSMRLFRQPGPGQWMPVFEGIAAEIKKLPAYAERAGDHVPPAGQSQGRHPSAFELAVQYHQGGDLRQAEKFYQQVGAEDPRYAEALHCLGLIAFQDGRIDQAVASMSQAVGLRPDYAEAHNNLGVALQNQQKLVEASASLHQALRLNPEFAEAHNNLGNVLKDQGRFDAALASYQEALRLKPRDAEVHYNLGIVLHEQKKLGPAAEAYREALRLKPNYVDAHIRLGNLLGEQGKPREAIVHYREVLRLKPEFVEIRRSLEACLKQAGAGDAPAAVAKQPRDAAACIEQGLALQSQGKWAEAEASFRQAIDLKPDFALAHGNLGFALQKQGKLVEAEASYRAALRYQPDLVDAHSRLGDMLLLQGRLQEAEDSFRRARRLDADNADTCSNLGYALLEKGRADEAQACFEQALRLTPDDPGCHHNLAHVLLLKGDYQEGWAEHEWRLRRQDRRPQRVFSQPLWDGSELAGRTILLHWEQGFGDTIQFIRYASLVKERGGTVIALCQKTLAPLLAGCKGIDRVVPQGAPLPAFDTHAPLMSLPHIFHTTVSTIPAQVPYLFADPKRCESWAQLLVGGEGLKVGIAWRGNPSFQADVRRSMPLTAFAPLAEIEGVRLVSLQHGAGTEELRMPTPHRASASAMERSCGRFPILDLGSRFEDFADTAAAIMNLDLVITVDSAVAHCAGALGVPVWVLLRSAACFRWLQQREDSPWYPSLRLFRQSRWGDWDGVFERVKQALQERVGAGSRIRENAAVTRGVRSGSARGVGEGDFPPRLLTNAAAAAFDQAVQQHQAGKLRQAERLYRQVLKDDPRHAEALHYLGLVVMQDGRLDDAVQCLNAALALRPDWAEAHNNLGVVLQKQQHLPEAADSLGQALRLKPDFAEAHNNLGNVLKDQGRFADAFASYQQALRLKPGDAEVCFNLGIVLHDQKKVEEATDFYREALRLRPNYLDACVRLGNALAEQGRLEESALQYRQALRLKPDFAECHINLGNSLKEMGLLDEAQTSYRQALRLKPDLVEAHLSLGNAFLQAGRLEESEACYLRGLEIQADHPDANWNLALLRLLRGEFKRGWEGYEWRWRRPDHPWARVGPQPRWQGESLAGRTILLQAEQGLGDTIQFIRYAPLVKKLGATVLLACHSPLQRLLSRCAGIDRVLALDDPRPPFDTYVPVMSLPRVLGTTSLDHIPADVPYLEADPELTRLWRDRLQALAGLRVGITWQGNPAYRGDRWRSAPLHCFQALSRVPGLSLVSLQKGSGSEQLAKMPDLAFDAGPYLTDLAETAAAVQALDLVVTVDSVLVHLAGALGVPVWVALPFAPDWRWLLERSDSPWYPSARLFRQTRQGDWNDVFERIAQEAQKLAVVPAATSGREGKQRDQAWQLDRAAERLQAGDLEQAERHCRHILREDPRHVDALHLLGVIAHKTGRPDEALAILSQALASRPDSAELYNCRGLMLQTLERGTEAEDSYRQALALKGDYAEAHYNLGNALAGSREAVQAEASYRQALRCKPNFAEAHNNLGNLLLRSGRLDEALASYQQAVQCQPGYAEAHKNLATVLRDMGKLDQAAASYRKAIRLKPAYFETHHNLAYTLGLQGKHAEAEASYRQALRVRPDHAETLNNLGVALAAQGKSDEALASYQEAVRVQPDYAGAHYNLGNTLRDRGQLAQAAASYRETVRLRSDQADAHNNLGLVLLAQGQVGESLASFAEALRCQPDFVEAHYNRGLALMKVEGKSPEALACFKRALRNRPRFAEAHNNIGLVLQEQGKLDQAVASYRQALAIKPAFGEAHNNLGSALGLLGALDDAVASLRLAVRLQPGNAEMHDNLGIAQLDLGNLEDAQTNLQKAIDLKPTLASAHCNLAMLREQLNDFPAAQDSLRQALRHDPGSPVALGHLATLLRGKLPDEDVAAMRRLLADPSSAAAGLTDEYRAALHFGLAQVLDARGQWTEAAEHLGVGNALILEDRRRRGQGYDPAMHSWWVERMLAVFTAKFFRGARTFGVDSERPVFVFGLPRSGTTLIEQVLASHSQVFGAGELRLAREDFELLMGLGSRDFRTMDAAAFDGIARLDLPAARRLAQRHLGELQALNGTAARIVDKMPDNYLYLGLLATLFPRAKFIHCRRDLRDLAVSCWMTHFRHVRWTNDFEHIASRFREYGRVMQHWKKVLPVQILEVSYEEMVADFEPAARRLLAWCGLAWEPACLKFHEGTRPVRTASMTQVRQPIYTSSVGRWQHYEKALAPLFAKLANTPRRASGKRRAAVD